jgi:hypothetical protein
MSVLFGLKMVPKERLEGGGRNYSRLRGYRRNIERRVVSLKQIDVIILYPPQWELEISHKEWYSVLVDVNRWSRWDIWGSGVPTVRVDTPPTEYMYHRTNLCQSFRNNIFNHGPTIALYTCRDIMFKYNNVTLSLVPYNQVALLRYLSFVFIILLSSVC